MSAEALALHTGKARSASPVLKIEGLRLAYRVGGKALETVRGVSLQVARGEAYGLVGESGCGKSTVAFAAVHYLADNVVPLGGRILLGGKDVSSLSGSELRLLRRSVVSMVYQSASTALNPTLTIGRQVAEVFELRGLSRHDAVRHAKTALRKVKIADVDKVMHSYPYQLSGGMQQRVVIAMAISASPELIILDEPTTGLDATVEADIIDLLRDLRAELGISYLFISHNLGVIAQICDRVGVLYAGQLVEEGRTGELFDAPRHPYTSRLLQCVPQWGARKADGPLATIPGFPPRPGATISGCVFYDRCPLAKTDCAAAQPPAFDHGTGHVSWCLRHEDVPGLKRDTSLPAGAHAERISQDGIPAPLELRHVDKSYGEGSFRFQVLSHIEFSLRQGEVLGVVGESGSGKSTLANVIAGLQPADSGSGLLYKDAVMPPRVQDRDPEQVRAIQMVFQDPGSSLNPRHTIGGILGRTVQKSLALKGGELDARVRTVAEKVRLDTHHLAARPSELSGGLKQRVAIGRAIAGAPQIIICDEPTSALDVSVQAAIVNLLVDLQRSEGLSFVFVSHDLGVVRYISDRIMVLYLGRVMEIGPAAAVFEGPHHPYTEALLSSAPHLGGEDKRIVLNGEMARHASPPSGCVFHTRCFRKIAGKCDVDTPPLQTDGAGHEVFCHIPLAELGRQGAMAPSTMTKAVATGKN
ncbi:dipeptide ABC transporter ATP-binding protein [Paracoccus denitrificans]|uniref:dipeptide ABC transporter ATP-binding protein n=1 Tax=Paracoccus denitrificans TaxID=266 RepID=UPI000CEC55FB|nr:ABC transporter ATP-binding protein [Paracoccus denitrificans]